MTHNYRKIGIKITLLITTVLSTSEVNARPQVSYSGGTILVTTITNNNVTVAEDSRIKNLETGEYSDDDCKIKSLGGKLIFGFSGIPKFDIIDANHPLDVAAATHWNARATAVRAYRRVSRKTAHEAAEQFAVFATNAFDNLRKAIGPVKLIRMAGGHPDDLSMAVFAGIGPSGKPEAFAIRFFYSDTKQAVDSEIGTGIVPSAADPFGAFASGSDTRIVDEMKSDRTFRAHMELSQWKQSVAAKTFDEKASLFAVQLVKWEIMYSGDPNIGGEADYMILSRDGIADHRKTRCQGRD